MKFFKSKQKTEKSKPADNLWLFVGLGNPGNQYAGNRHNVGFMVIDQMAQDHGAAQFRSKFQGRVSDILMGDQKVILLKPTTFMNNSGLSVNQTAKFYKIKPDRIVVFYDELDLVFGKIRMKLGGGLAGHNGLKSIKGALGTPEFRRVRIGIDHPGDKDRVSGYVLSDFSKAEQKSLPQIVSGLSAHMSLILDGDTEQYMSKVAQGLQI